MTNFLESIHAPSLVQKLGEGFLSEDQLQILGKTAFSTTSYTPVNYQARINFYKLSSYDFTINDGIVTGSEDLYVNSQNKATNFESIKHAQIHPDHLRLLVKYYSLCYPNHSFTSVIHLSLQPTASTTILPLLVSENIKLSKTFQSDIFYSSRRARSLKGAYIQSFFKGPNFTDPVASYYGEIGYFFQHTLFINNKNTIHIFAFVKWFRLFSSNIDAKKNN